MKQDKLPGMPEDAREVELHGKILISSIAIDLTKKGGQATATVKVPVPDSNLKKPLETKIGFAISKSVLDKVVAAAEAKAKKLLG